MKTKTPIPGKGFTLTVNAEIDDLLVSARNLTPAGFINQAIDELTEIVPGDSGKGVGQKSAKIFRLTHERLAKIAQVAADTGLSENDVTIAAIRQYARKLKS